MRKVYKNKILIVFLLYNLFLFIGFFICKKINIVDKVVRYILFNTKLILFKDLLSIGITILAIIIGAMITAATILMSMCNTRLMKLINRYGKSGYIVSSIKESIITGIISVCLYAIVYSNVDLAILTIRLIILYFANLLLILFVIKSKVLIGIVLKLLNDSLSEDDSIVTKPKFFNPNNKKGD